mmetsp:Transcript_86161/g.257150  ORF Transcript_86161/g.257150 Transcript_86161/m.257150 type:complete len:258 (-) Transcript_86161:1628-2401(-)
MPTTSHRYSFCAPMALNILLVLPQLPGYFTLGCPKSTDMLTRLSSISIGSYLGFFSGTSSPTTLFGIRRIANVTGSATCLLTSSSPAAAMAASPDRLAAGPRVGAVARRVSKDLKKVTVCLSPFGPTTNKSTLARTAVSRFLSLAFFRSESPFSVGSPLLIVKPMKSVRLSPPLSYCLSTSRKSSAPSSPLPLPVSWKSVRASFATSFDSANSPAPRCAPATRSSAPAWPSASSKSRKMALAFLAVFCASAKDWFMS